MPGPMSWPAFRPRPRPLRSCSIHISSRCTLSEGLSIVLLGEDTRGVRRCAAVVTATAGTAAASNALASLTPLHEALQPLPCRLSTQQLIDLLKHPLCVGQSRRIVLDQLENRYASKFADHWNFV